MILSHLFSRFGFFVYFCRQKNGRMEKCAIIVAGGKGTRMGKEIPKQFLPVAGKAVLMHTISAFHRYDSNIHIILVLPEEQKSYWNGLCKLHSFGIPHEIVPGGNSRFQSVKNGLHRAGSQGLIAVHDGVRPFVSRNVIEVAFRTAESEGSAVPVLKMTDSIREITENNKSIARNRSRYVSVQTPQTFRADILQEAYNREYDERFTDDASVVEAAGYPVSLIESNRENIKITVPFDLQIAEIIAKQCRI